MHQPPKWPGHLKGFRQTPTLNGEQHRSGSRQLPASAYLSHAAQPAATGQVHRHMCTDHFLIPMDRESGGKRFGQVECRSKSALGMAPVTEDGADGR